ncbi:MAG: hypothetical protein KDM81_16115, partial [Verrucomicrobiae bacterium]|nr:hypothetical protein [Verrucomicrobiae bacterium]
VHRGSKDRVVLLKAIADCSFELQDYPEAVRCLREARAIGGETILSGSKFEMRLKLFEQIYESWTHPEGIAASLQEVLEAADDSAHDLGIRDDYLPLIAQLYAEFRQYEAALQVLNPLLHNADGSMTPVAHGNLGLFAPLAEVLCAMKDPDDASRLINQVMAVHEAQHTNAASLPAEYLRIQGTIRTEAGELEAGEQALRGALSHPLGAPDQRLGPHQRVRSLAPLAWNLARQQRFEEANALLREALTLAAQSELREADEPKVLQSAAAVAGAGGEWHRAMDYCLRDRTHYPNSARTLLLRCLFAEEQAFENDRRGFLQVVADSEDRLVLSGLLRAAALRPADASDAFRQFLPKLVDRLQGRLSDSSPVMQDELRLALAGAARLVGNGPAMEHWADQVSPNDALLHGQARLLQGIALQGQGRASEAAAALRTAEALVPFLAEASPDLAGARWEDRLRCRLLQQELHRCLAGTNDVAPAETAPGQ